jgi:hypothetical protein
LAGTEEPGSRLDPEAVRADHVASKPSVERRIRSYRKELASWNREMTI